MDTWTKRSYVCDPNNCDALYEITVNDKYPAPVANITCHCGRNMQWIDEKDATIGHSTTKEGNMEYQAATAVIDMQADFDKFKANHQNCDYWKSENGRVQSQIIDLINDAYENETDSEDILTTLCEIIDYNPVKEIEFSGTIQFTGRIEVPLNEVAEFDLEDALSDMYVDINNGNVTIDNYDIYEVQAE